MTVNTSSASLRRNVTHRPNSTFGLSWRFLIRDWRSGELWLLVAALLMAVAVSTAIALFSERLQLALGRQVAEVLGADMLIRSPGPVQPVILEAAENQGLTLSTVLEFPSVVMAGDEMQMVSAKAVENNYPLRGHIRTADQPFAPDQIVSDTPGVGEAWLEPRLFPLLGVAIGDQVMLGNTWLTITRAITLETDRGGDFYSFSPRLMFSMADLESTGIIQPGSRVSWKTLMAGELSALEQFKAWSKDRLDDSERLMMADDSRRDLRNSVVRLKQFLGLASMAAMLLAGVAVAMASQRFAERRFDSCAVMRCLGASRQQVLRLLLVELAFVAVLVALPGVLIGWFLQAGVVQLLKGVLPAWLPAAGIMPMVIGGATGVITLAGFGLAPLLRLQDVSPLRVLRRDLSPAPAASWLVYGFSLMAVFLLLWYHTGEVVIALVLALASGAVLLMISLGVQLLLAHVGNRQRLSSLPVFWRPGVSRIIQGKGKTSAQLLAFTLTFMAMAVVLLLRTDLLDRWQNELPKETPNYFAMNIQPSEVEAYSAFLTGNDVDTSQLYPIIRGRLVGINDLPVREAVSKEEQNHNALNRELNMTWSETLPEKNRLEAGDWWEPGSEEGLSIEAEIAEKLGVGLGDRLTFIVSGHEFTETVSSIRTVQWESFRPNFYMIFPEAVLQDLPTTWLNSFYLDIEDKLLLNALITQFPTMTLLDLDAVINQVQKMLAQSTIAVEAMLAALLLAGLLVMMSVIESSIDERLHEGALIRSLGGTRRQLLMMQVGEFVLFGILAGLLAACGTELASYLLNTRVFELSWQPAWFIWFALPLFGALVLGFAGWLGIRRVLRESPANILQAG
ncbi:ABC transporter permease [Endozoicomonas sp. SCSIO W0465]|uniref:ABC transporter permease n=1 Tax=Endozoicomonas sp. SCSIO W0465 TaxID=2918516 RepID=UPI0020757934|nr:FtsX-like permease family protein [Endozoicomonas sp. SCSIO W0465]USE36494.1 FtsX-like permease family protein [Endozoicomonas sp. SCSIO W0465]